MFLLFVTFNFLTGLSVKGDLIQDASPYTNVGNKVRKNEGALGFYASLNTNLTPINATYIDRDVNQVVIPTKFYEEHTKKKKIKKSPKRTIQKIIKKGKNRSRKIYVHPATRQPTVATAKAELDDSDGYNDERTTESRRKRYKKKPKVPRYPMPFHNLQRNMHSRNKRESNRKDLYIIKDLDELEFVGRGDDYDVVNAHIEKYW